MEIVAVPTNAGRLINAVARIGYDPEVALTDLIDNSIDAGSEHINVTFVPGYEEEDGANTTAKYIIADDGCGMNRDSLIGAFTLGTLREYAPHSLGKFGLGLKSAGLSLGNRIVLISKTADMSEPMCAVLSLEAVEASGEYAIEMGEIPNEFQSDWDEYSVDQVRGTVLLLVDLNDNQPRSYSNFVEYFRRYCGITYHMFLQDEQRPVELRINGEVVEPIDPIFEDEAHNHGSLGDPENWDGRSVNLLLEDVSLRLTPQVTATIAATHLVHPPSFEAEGKRNEMFNYYQIGAEPYHGRQRHGFYVYRNRRVIVMAERFHGLVSSQTQAWAFRGRLTFDEAADNILSLDVKKRHCQLPREARNNLRAMITTHHQKSIQAWRAAGAKVARQRGEAKDQLASESIADTPVAHLGYAPGSDLSSQAAVEARNKLLEEIGTDTLGLITDTDVTEEVLNQRAQEKSIVSFVQGLRGNTMWLPYPAIQFGAAETLINLQHSWISEAYAAAEEDARITLILHQLFTILARAELEVRSSSWNDLPQGATDKVLERFRRKASAIGEDLAETLIHQLLNLRDSGEELETE